MGKSDYVEFRLIDLVSAFKNSFLVFNDVKSVLNFKRNIELESNKIETSLIVENSKRLVYDIVEKGLKFPILYGHKDEKGILTLVGSYETILPFLFLYDKFDYEESYKRNYADKILIRILVSEYDSDLWIHLKSIDNTKTICQKLFQI